MDFLIKVIMALFFGVKRHWHILFAIILGVMMGLLFHENNWGQDERGQFLLEFFEFVGQIFIRLITMIVIPLVVSSLIVGVSSLKDARQLGRMGGKVFAFFLFLMTLTALLGAGLTYVAQPGENMQQHIDEISRTLHIAQPMDLRTLEAHHPVNLKQVFLDMIPLNPVASLASMNLVPTILFTILLGFALAFIGQAGKPMISFFESLFTATMKLTDWMMIMAVPGVFALAFVTFATSGFKVVLLLLPFVGVVITGLLIQILLIFPILLYVLARIDFLNLYRAISEAILVAFGTASSSATLPITIANCEYRAGISNRVASFVLPTGASINKTATTMFQVMAVMFLAQAYGISLDPMTIGMIVFLGIIASIAAAGVPSAGMITMTLIITSLGEHFTLETFAGGIWALWAIDRVLDMCRTVTNVISSVTVAAIVAASEGELKRDMLNNPAAWKEVI